MSYEIERGIEPPPARQVKPEPTSEEVREKVTQRLLDWIYRHQVLRFSRTQALRGLKGSNTRFPRSVDDLNASLVHLAEKGDIDPIGMPQRRKDGLSVTSSYAIRNMDLVGEEGSPVERVGVGRPPVFPFASMEVGDSFFIPCEDEAEKIKKRGSAHASAHYHGCRARVQMGDGGIRVWKLAKKGKEEHLLDKTAACPKCGHAPNAVARNMRSTAKCDGCGYTFDDAYRSKRPASGTL